jgi:hypothetical protein
MEGGSFLSALGPLVSSPVQVSNVARPGLARSLQNGLTKCESKL